MVSTTFDVRSRLLNASTTRGPKTTEFPRVVKSPERAAAKPVTKVWLRAFPAVFSRAITMIPPLLPSDRMTQPAMLQPAHAESSLVSGTRWCKFSGGTWHREETRGEESRREEGRGGASAEVEKCSLHPLSAADPYGLCGESLPLGALKHRRVASGWWLVAGTRLWTALGKMIYV